MKKCIRCGINKELNDFYAHPKMRDGHLNKCVECCKEVANIREKTLRKNSEEWCEKERLRSIEKYHRLNYKEVLFEQKKLKPYINGIYKNLSRDLNLSSDKNAHHWNYTLIKDVIILDKRFHRFIHQYLILNEKTLMFETKEGNVLDTKDKHLEFIKKLKLIFKNI